MSSRSRGGSGSETSKIIKRSYLHTNGVNYMLENKCDWSPSPAEGMTLIERDDWPEGLTIQLSKKAKGIKLKKPKIRLYKVNDENYKEAVYWIKCKEVLDVDYGGLQTIRIRMGERMDQTMSKGSFIKALLGTCCAVVHSNIVKNYLLTSEGVLKEMNAEDVKKFGKPDFTTAVQLNNVRY